MLEDAWEHWGDHEEEADKSGTCADCPPVAALELACNHELTGLRAGLVGLSGVLGGDIEGPPMGRCIASAIRESSNFRSEGTFCRFKPAEAFG